MSNTEILDVIPSWFWNFSTYGNMIIDVSKNQIHREIHDFHNVVYSFSIINLNSNNLKGRLPRIPAIVHVLDLSNNSFSRDMSYFLCYPKSNPSTLVVLNPEANFFIRKDS